MDLEKFIGFMRLYPLLWKKTNCTSVTRKHIEKLWDAIAADMDATKIDCKKKWKYLKYHHRRALKKYPQQPGTPASEALKARFKYAEQMAFMKYDDECGNEEYIHISDDDLLDYEDSYKETQPIYQKNITPLRRNPDIRDEMEIESKKIKHLSEDVATDKNKDQECGHLLFFKSLIPFIQHLSPMQTLSLRGEIQQVVLKYVANRHGNNNSFDQDPLN